MSENFGWHVMGIQTKGSQDSGQEAHLQQSPMMRQSSWGSLTLEEVRSKFEGSRKSLGGMNLDELLKNVRTTEVNRFSGIGRSGDASPSSSSAHRQPSSSLARAMSAKTVDELWKEIQQGQRKRSESGDQKLGEMTLEDFLVQAGLFDETSRSPSTGLEHSAEEGMPQDFPPLTRLSSAPSIGSLSDVTTTTSRRKRGDPEAYEKAIERRLKRKIKNRESAARSRARKQVSRFLQTQCFMGISMLFPNCHVYIRQLLCAKLCRPTKMS